MAKSKKKMGRPSKGADAKTFVINCKVSEREIQEFKRRSGALSVSAWVLQPRRDELKRDGFYPEEPES